MAFKLSKAEEAQRADLVSELATAAAELQEAIDAFNTAKDEAATDLQTAVDAYNQVLAEAKDTLAEAVQAYNDKLSEARDFAGQIAADADNDISDKSDKWQEGERGQAAVAWKDEWENARFDDIELQYPDDVEVNLPDDVSDDSDDHGETLDQLPAEMEA